jgi:hypothetical protein
MKSGKRNKKMYCRATGKGLMSTFYPISEITRREQFKEMPTSSFLVSKSESL